MKTVWAWVLLGCFIAPRVMAFCGVQDINHPPPALKPIQTGLLDLQLQNQVLLGLDGGGVSASTFDLPKGELSEGVFDIPPHWSEKVDWSAYANRYGGISLFTLYFDDERRLCRLETYKLSHEFFTTHLKQWDQRELGASLRLTDALRQGKQADAELKSLQVFDYDALGKLIRARQFGVDDSKKITLREQMCYFRDSQSRLIGEIAQESACPKTIPINASPRYFYSPQGKIRREIHQNLGVVLQEVGTQFSKMSNVVVHDPEGVSAHYLHDANRDVYRKPLADLKPQEGVTASIEDLIVTPNWQLTLLDFNLPRKNVDWSIKKLIDGVNPYGVDVYLSQEDIWLKPLMQGNTDEKGRVNLTAAQRKVLWDAVSKNPGRYFMGYSVLNPVRLYPKVDDKTWEACLSLDEESAVLCR